MSRRDRIKDLYTVAPATELAGANSVAARAELPSSRILAGPVRTMSLTLDRMEEESRQLQTALAAGATIVDLDPALVDPSIVRDRFQVEGDEGLETLRASIAEHGQEVPILVRPHPAREGRYQVAYGHRRLRAVSSLGRNVRAVVKQLSDAELVVAQGVENSARQDLSYVERALFATALEDRGFERSIIMAALSTDKGELSKLITVARSVPAALVQAIGPAPKTGRRRWLALAEALKAKGVQEKAIAATHSAEFANLDSDARFASILQTALTRLNEPVVREWSNISGTVKARISRSSRSATLALDARSDPEFVDFVVSELDKLYEAFVAQAQARAAN